MQRIIKRFLKKTHIIRNRVSYLALASLLFVAPYTVFGASYEVPSLQVSSNACVDLSDTGINLAGLVDFDNYSGVFPSTATVINGGLASYSDTFCPLSMTGRPSGDYWISAKEFGGTDTFYGRFTWNGTTVTPAVIPPGGLMENQIDETNQTRLFTADFTASSSNLFANVGYYIDTSEFFGQYDRPDVVFITVYESDNTVFEQKQKIILPLVTGNATTSLDFVNTIPDGDYFATINFYNFSLQEIVIPRVFITKEFTVAGGVITSITTTNVSNALLPRNMTVYEECSITKISGCINNSFRFLFYPSVDSINLFTENYSQLQTKVPFVYLTQASDLMTGLYTGTAGVIPAITIETGIGDITMISEAQVASIPYVDTLRSLISAGMWLMLFRILYRKTLTIHDKVTV